MRRHGLFSGGPVAGYAGAIPSITVSSVWAGNVTDESATVKARSADASAATLRYSTDPGLAGYSTAAGTEGSDEVWSFSLSGLSADTLYYYGFTGSDVTGQVRTLPTAGAAASFGLWAASCGGHSGGEYVTNDVSNAPTYLRIADRLLSGDLIGGIHLGDRHYRDYNGTSATTRRGIYHDVMAAVNQLALHKAGWMDYMHDDHDWCGNDTGGSATGGPIAQQVYREHVPWTLPLGSGGVYHAYSIGRVLFVNLDVRSYRSSNGATDNSSKTMLGTTQKQWLKDTVLAATESLVVIHTGSPWNGSASISWGVFSTERDELIDYFDTNSLTTKLFMVHGDNHFLAYDDGTNAPGGIPTANLAPLDAGFTGDDGTWTTGIIKSEQQQYGALYFTDTGSQITVNVKGWSVANPSGTETLRIDESVVYTG